MESYHEEPRETLVFLHRVLTRRDWDQLQDYLRACPGSCTERVYAGTYAVFVPAGGALERAA